MKCTDCKHFAKKPYTDPDATLFSYEGFCMYRKKYKQDFSNVIVNSDQPPNWCHYE